jgi:copper transport protein
MINAPPASVAMTFSEEVEPRFAIVSVTDAGGRQVTAGSPRRDASGSETIVVPLERVPQGWYLVYWRVVSADGHPVRGAFTFAVGPNPGPAPEFVIPSISETAATPKLVAARAVVFFSVLVAIGLFVLRIAIARPVVRRVQGSTLRGVTIAFAAAAAVGLAATPVYVLLATADFALRPWHALGELVPLLDGSSFGRGFLVLELCFALFVLAAVLALWVDRPERPQRSVAELLATAGALAAAAAVLFVPGVAGHAAQTPPRGIALSLNWLHLIAGAVWLGGLVGLLVLWRSLPAARRVAGLVVSVPRFSNVAIGLVLLLLATGIWATAIHMPTWGALWETSYGQTVLVKIALFTAAVALAAGNLTRARPRLAAARVQAELGARPAGVLRRLVGGEALLLVGAVTAAGLLASLAPPSKALARAGGALARVGPGPVQRAVEHRGYELRVVVAPNRAAVQNSFALRITRDGAPVRGAAVKATFSMLDMEMGDQIYRLTETRPGLYAHDAPALVMVGHWGLAFDVAPPRAEPFTAFIVDRVRG